MELEQLAIRIRRGDKSALRELITTYGADVYQKAYQRVKDPQMAREVTRQTFAQFVTALQERTQSDGWQLWLDTLSERNIDSYMRMTADLEETGKQLNRELFQPEQAVAPQLAEPRAAVEPQKTVAPQRLAQPHAAARAQRYDEPAYNQQVAWQAQQTQPEEIYYYEDEQDAPAPAPRPASQKRPPQKKQRPSASDPAKRAHSSQEAARRKQREKRAERIFDETPQEKRSSAGGFTVALLVMVCIALVWVVVGVTMSLGWLPVYDLGYSWFNANVYPFF